MALTNEERRQIAALKYDPGYISLLKVIDSDLNGLLTAMESADEDSEFLRIGRLWRAGKRISSRLHSAPEDISAELDALGLSRIEEFELPRPR